MSLGNLAKPQKLTPGDKVAVVSPSWGGAGQFPHRYETGKRQLAEVFNVEVVDMPCATKPADWVAQNPKARAEDLMMLSPIHQSQLLSRPLAATILFASFPISTLK